MAFQKKEQIVKFFKSISGYKEELSELMEWLQSKNQWVLKVVSLDMDLVSVAEHYETYESGVVQIAINHVEGAVSVLVNNRRTIEFSKVLACNDNIRVFKAYVDEIVEMAKKLYPHAYPAVNVETGVIGKAK